MEPVTFPVEAGHVMLFARAVGDPNPIYRDPDHAATTEVGTVIAPPTFTEALQQFIPDYHMRPRIGEPWIGSGRTPSGTAGAEPAWGSTLHAEQHFTYHRPVRAGEILTATTRAGETWEKQGRRGGRLVFHESITEFRDDRDSIVVVARMVAVDMQRAVEA